MTRIDASSLTPAPPAGGPLRLVAMGVTGSGKSTLAQALADALGLRCVDGDDLHDPASVAKMRAGTALTDDDRWPWLVRIGQQLAQAGGAGLVVSCSALRRAYRDAIRQQAAGVRFLFLDGPDALIRERMQRRTGHYMPVSLLDTQLQLLERPAADEPDVLPLDLALPMPALLAQALQRLRGA